MTDSPHARWTVFEQYLAYGEHSEGHMSTSGVAREEFDELAAAEDLGTFLAYDVSRGIIGRGEERIGAYRPAYA